MDLRSCKYSNIDDFNFTLCESEIESKLWFDFGLTSFRKQNCWTIKATRVQLKMTPKTRCSRVILFSIFHKLRQLYMSLLSFCIT